MVNFTINLYHHGFFVGNPLQYVDGDLRVVHNVNFEGVIYLEFCHNFHKLVFMAPVSYFYIKTGVQMNIEDDQDLSDNENQDTLDDVKDLVDFQIEDESNVVIPKISSDDSWFNKPVGLGKFIGHIDDLIPPLNGRFMLEINDPEEDDIDSLYKVKKKGLQYPAFDPETPWNQCQPILGMRFESPTQLKQCLANYGVTNGYQLWFMQNEIHKLLVLCGRDVSKGRCAGKRGKKDNENANNSSKGQGSKESKGEKLVK
ncbi:hypothetical protein CTI12_AA315800 [Artemisia annua]|uniref:Uncharacterized protein n=1 Tax=Artemisia annua TaxID=35608 RepID=A0A2U1N2P4_ARTAN|nr:hypothetical protein CTI12_AA315800 [Artemisia annua]